MKKSKVSESLLSKRWVVPETEKAEKSLVERMLKLRGISDGEEFFEPKWEKWMGKWRDLPDAEKAVERILEAKEKNEKVRIWGDYDADGVTATTLMFLALQEIGIENVDFKLPHRVEDGYGLSKKVIEKCVEDGVQLLITVDCGVTNVEEIELANEKGMDVIVTDHHAVLKKIPEAVAVVNPKRLKNGPGIVGAVVAFRLGEGLIETVKGKSEADRWLRWNVDLAALATVADCANLQEENRALVHFGLKGMGKICERRPGMKVLCELSKVDPEKMRGEDIGFRLAPRINAAGRVAHPEEAIKLLLAPNAREAREYAERLQKLNNDRQKLTRNAVESTVSALEGEIHKNSIIFHKSADFHAGIVGLVAGRLCEKFGRPAIVGEKREGVVVASCRSIAEWHVAEALAEIGDLLERFGGHRMAAGFTCKKENWDEVVKKLSAHAHEILEKVDLKPRLKMDAVLEAGDLSLKIWKELQKFEPFGVGNEAPVFYLPEGVVTESRQVGSTKAHLKMKIGIEGKELGAIFFGGGVFAKKLGVGTKCELAVTLEKHVWNGWADLELSIVDCKISPEMK